MTSINKIILTLGLDADSSIGYSISRFRKLIENGLAKESKPHIFNIIPQTTNNRRKKKLNQQESEKIEKLARVIATASYIWNDKFPQVRDFMLSPHALLAGETPYDVSLSELGARQVEEILWSIFYGLPA